jgi:hypothetical protein
MDEKLKVAETEKEVLKEVVLKLRRSTENLRELESRIGQVTVENEALVEEHEAVTVARAELVSLIIENNAMDQKVRYLENEREAIQEGLLKSNRSNSYAQELEARIAQLQDDKESLAEENWGFRNSSKAILAGASAEPAASRMEDNKLDQKVKTLEKKEEDSAKHIVELKLAKLPTEPTNCSQGRIAVDEASVLASVANTDNAANSQTLSREKVEIGSERVINEKEKSEASSDNISHTSGIRSMQVDNESGPGLPDIIRSNFSTRENEVDDTKAESTSSEGRETIGSSESRQTSLPPTESVMATAPSKEHRIPRQEDPAAGRASKARMQISAGAEFSKTLALTSERNETGSQSDSPESVLSSPLPPNSASQSSSSKMEESLQTSEIASGPAVPASTTTEVSHDASVGNADATPQSHVDDERTAVRVFQRMITIDMHYHDRKKKERVCTVKANYTGPMVDGVPHGSGMIRFQNGSMYVGSFENGCMHGNGVFNHKKRGGKRKTFTGIFHQNEYG